MIAALIVAAGQGTRMQTKRPKQFLKLAGLPILSHTLKAFDRCPAVTHIYVTLPKSDISHCQKEVIDAGGFETPLTLVAGGKRRQDSVFNGLEAIADTEGIVLIHDGVRPLVSAALIESSIASAQRYGACVPGLPVIETLKQVNTDHNIHCTVPRNGLYTAQTPQAFHLSLIKKAHIEARQQGWQATDDASLVERLGEKVHLIAGDRKNLKITTPEDLAWANAYFDAHGSP